MKPNATILAHLLQLTAFGWAVMGLFVFGFQAAPALAQDDSGTATCDMDQLQAIIAKGFTAIAKSDWDTVMPVGVTLRVAAQACKEQRQILTGYVYGDYFLAEGFLGQNDRKSAKKYADDGVAACRIAEHFGKYPELTDKMEARFESLRAAIAR